MTEAKHVATSMFNQYKLSKHDTNVIPYPLVYCSIVGGLQYLIVTRSDITFSLTKSLSSCPCLLNHIGLQLNVFHATYVTQ